MEAPKRGAKSPMARADFLNLAGRAGRLRREFHGNVWCLHPENWEKRCYEGEPLQQIRSAFDEVFDDGGSAVRLVFERDDDIEDSSTAVAALGRAFTQYIQANRPLPIFHDNAEYAQSLGATVSLLEVLRVEVQLPVEIFAANSGVHPRRLEALYSFFQAHEDLEELLPIKPKQKNVNVRLRQIFQCVQRLLSGVDNDSYRYHGTLAAGWIHEESLKQIIANELNFRQQQSGALTPLAPAAVRNFIYRIIETIEHDLRFRYVKHLRAYHDVLAFELRRRGRLDEATDLVPMHLYLENGAFRNVPINLMSLGLTRVSALLLSKQIVLRSDATPEECLRSCRAAILNAPGLKLPATVRREIATLAGG